VTKRRMRFQEVLSVEALVILLISLICISIFGTFFNSILSRRKQGISKHLHRARMNIHMGVMFVSISLLQFVTIQTTAIQKAFIAIIFVLGLINGYYGIKNHHYFKQQRQEKQEASQS
jgi:hypothetical protein